MLADLCGRWIHRVHARRPPGGVVLDMDSSVSPMHGAQEMSAWKVTPERCDQGRSLPDMARNDKLRSEEPAIW